MRVATILCSLLLAACAPPPVATRSKLAIEPGKQAEDERIASMARGVTYEKIAYASTDGLAVPAYLFEPADRGDARRPAVVYLHGGEHGTFSSRLVPRVTPLVARGWVVLAPDYRGSSGYGKAYHDAADYGGMEIDDALAARDWLVDSGRADPRRIAVMGASHGGYNALMAVARRPSGFACCVDFFGPTDLVYRVTSTPEENPNAAPGDPAKFARMVGATIDEDPAAYRARSPRFVADRIRVPVLVIHGTDDEIVRFEESAWLVAALREAGHDAVELVAIEGARHGHPVELFDPARERALEFMGECLGR